MRAHRLVLPAAALMVALLAPAAFAQEPEPPAERPGAEPPSAAGNGASAETGGPQLVYDREVFIYHAGGRRDPFAPLLSGEGIGPRFEELELRGVIVSDSPEASVALLVDRDDRLHRARRGERVGNARVMEITPTWVRFSVDTYGIIRTERLDLKQEEKGADR